MFIAYGEPKLVASIFCFQLYPLEGNQKHQLESLTPQKVEVCTQVN